MSDTKKIFVDYGFLVIVIGFLATALFIVVRLMMSAIIKFIGKIHKKNELEHEKLEDRLTGHDKDISEIKGKLSK